MLQKLLPLCLQLACLGGLATAVSIQNSIDFYRNSELQADAAQSAQQCPPPKPHSQVSGCPRRSCRVDADCGESGIRCACDRSLCGAVCVRYNADCSPLPEVVNGYKIEKGPAYLNENSVGQVIQVSCRPPFSLEGSTDTIVCQGNLKWSHPMPRCSREEKCSPPARIPNTVVVRAPSEAPEYASGDQFVYACAPGYRSDRPDLTVSAICTRGQWNMRDIVCSVVSCGHPGDPANGKHLNWNYTYQQKVSYFCFEGYRLTCRSETEKISDCQVRTCNADGRWSGSVPECKSIQCPNLRNPPNGMVSKGWNFVNSVVQYSCHAGYRLVGTASRMCRRNGTWDGEVPRCVVQDCGPPPFVANAYRVQVTSTKYKARVTYTCLPDAKLEGENGGQIICQTDGRWVPAPPKCRSHCKVPTIAWGKALIGRPDGPPAVNKVPSDTTLWVRCDENYQLRRTLYPRCDNGTWTGIPSCVPKDCNDRPPLVKNGIARFYGTKHNDRVIYSCYVGYEAVRGSSVLTCRYGRWVGTPPVCTKKKCPWIESPAGVEKWLIGPEGIKNQWTRPQTTSDNEELVQFQCIGKGMALRGHTHAICLNGQWRPPGSPRCVRQMHKQIPHDWLFYRVGKR
ncbi:hypothetical protein BOX15_Mlig011105g2 [Macrostomum lignano]|uniref:Sushi domain-containing protein n=1 Tax=Macrostomum lignano TaxID=282301 RepID=A0A267EYY9_9PLAT|nr:hypothetical protein BOX15_Mlig011105g2 [Macrostomum lignano]